MESEETMTGRIKRDLRPWNTPDKREWKELEYKYKDERARKNRLKG